MYQEDEDLILQTTMETTPYYSVLQDKYEKAVSILEQFYRMDAILSDVWKGPNFKLSQTLTYLHMRLLQAQSSRQQVHMIRCKELWQQNTISELVTAN
jgi:hypothetical protein